MQMSRIIRKLEKIEAWRVEKRIIGEVLLSYGEEDRGSEEREAIAEIVDGERVDRVDGHVGGEVGRMDESDVAGNDMEVWAMVR